MPNPKPKPRPKGSPRTRVVVMMDPKLVQRLDALRDVNRSAYIEKLVRLALTPDQAA